MGVIKENGFRIGEPPAPPSPLGPNASRAERLRHARERAVSEYSDPNRAAEMEELKLSREEDLAAGRKRGEEEFKEGSLGRVDVNRSKAIADIINRRQQESQGFSADEQNAFRSQSQGEINQALQSRMRALKIEQAQAGTRGPVAAAQHAAALKEAGAANVANERELYLKNIDARRQGLTNYEQSVAGAEKGELERQLYNQSQQNKEKLAKIGTEYGYGSLGVGDRASLFQKWGSEDMAKATREAANKGSWLCTEANKLILFTDDEKITLISFLKEAKKIDKASTRFYISQCSPLIHKMNERGFNWVSNADFILDILYLCKNKQFKKAFDHYEEVTAILISEYWPECNHPCFLNYKEKLKNIKAVI